MKKQISATLLCLALVLATCAAASAQGPGSVRVQVPFEFFAGGRLMRAGGYTVRRVRADAEGALVIRGEDGRDTAVLLTNPNGDAPARASLTFRQYGGRYFLAEVSIPGTASVRGLVMPGGEKKAARRLSEGVGEVTVIGTMK